MMEVKILINGRSIAMLEIERDKLFPDGETAGYLVRATEEGKAAFGFQMEHAISLGATKLAYDALGRAREYGFGRPERLEPVPAAGDDEGGG